jgi:hypothetical protein
LCSACGVLKGYHEFMVWLSLDLELHYWMV